MDVSDVLTSAILQELSLIIDDKEYLSVISKRLKSSKVKKRLFYKVTKEIFYVLLTKGKVTLPPGYGSVQLKDLVSKEKKVFDRKTGESILLPVKKERRVHYSPGFSVNEFL